jgi:hypothetical protein
MGDEWPRPAMGVFHLTFLVDDHSAGRFFSVDTPWPVGPRHPGQLVAPAVAVKAITANTKVMGRIRRLNDFILKVPGTENLIA